MYLEARRQDHSGPVALTIDFKIKVSAESKAAACTTSSPISESTCQVWAAWRINRCTASNAVSM
eukprot:541997-Amphidinium_carterae.2